MNKTINFFLEQEAFDPQDLNNFEGLKRDENGYMKYRVCHTYKDTLQALVDDIDNIFTTSLINLSFDLIGEGYDIYLITKNKRIKCCPGMDNDTNKDIRIGHNIRKLLIGGALDHTLDFDRPVKFRVTFEDKEDSSIMKFLIEWKQLFENSKIEEDEKSIEDIIKDDEYIDYVDTKEYGLCKLYSSGFKKNGKVDLAFLDGNNKAHIFRDGKFV